MDTGRFLLAIVLMVAVIVVTNLLFPPAPAPPGTGGEAVESAGPAPAAPDTIAVPRPEAPRPEMAAPGLAPAADTVRAETLLVASPLYRYALSTRGAALVGAELLQYESFTRAGPVELGAPDIPALVSYGLLIDGEVLDLSVLPFRPEVAGRVELGAGAEPRVVPFVYQDPRGRFGVRIEYTFAPDDYVIRVSGAVHGLPAGTSPLLAIRLAPTLAVNEADPEVDHTALSYAVRGSREGIESVRLDDVDAERIENGPLQWAAVRNKYFLVGAIRAEAEDGRDFGGLIARPLAREHAADLTATLPLGADRAFDFRLFVGPQQYERLAALGYDLQDVTPFGWKLLQPILRPIAHLITWALVGLHETLSIGYGWVLILFGVLVRVVLWPLNARATRAQMKNMALQPRIQEIQTRYKNDPEKLQREMLRLYREEGFNPLGGCLPMLIPFPVLIALFFVFQNTIEFRGVEFLWLPDLSRPDPLYALPIVLGASMFLMQRITMRSAPPNPQMKMLLYFMPAFMVIIFINLASGLNLYYAAQNVASIPQQLQIARERARHRPPAR